MLSEKSCIFVAKIGHLVADATTMKREYGENP
jgi:hypothetical protein